ncbi:MAG: hypothetical protein ACRCVN_05960 [Spirochaetia bacterium]
MINYEEKDFGVVDYADVVAVVELKDTVSPPPRRWKNIAVLATKKADGRDLVGEVVTEKSQIENDINEIDELFFVGSIRVWNVDVDDDVLLSIRSYAETLVVLSGRDAVDYKDLIVWQRDVSPTSLDDWVGLKNHGAMLDPAGQGKTLFALTSLLETGIKYTNQITGAFSGINDTSLASELEEAGYSFFFVANDRIWLRCLQIGRQQARSVYADRSVVYDVKFALSQLVASGLDYNQEDTGLLELKILEALSANFFVDSVKEVVIPRLQAAADKNAGVIRGVMVKYVTATEVRTIYVTLGGE